MIPAKKSPVGSAMELVIVLASALGLALLVQRFLVKPYRIPSGSMLPTLHIGQRLLVDRIGADFTAPHLGDVVVFHPPNDYGQGCADPDEGQNGEGQDAHLPCGVPRRRPSAETFIKRVVGLPGDHISIRDGHVIRNGVPERDPYIVPCGAESSCEFPGPVRIPRGDYFVLGDNRPDSEDSRFWGPVPRSWIVGKAFFTYWPPDRAGFM